MHLQSPSSSGLGLRPFKAATRVRIPLGILDRIVLRPGTTLVGAERLSVAGLRPGHIRNTLGLLSPPQLHNAARASALAEQRIETVDCGLRAVIKQAAMPGQGKGKRYCARPTRRPHEHIPRRGQHTLAGLPLRPLHPRGRSSGPGLTSLLALLSATVKSTMVEVVGGASREWRSDAVDALLPRPPSRGTSEISRWHDHGAPSTTIAGSHGVEPMRTTTFRRPGWAAERLGSRRPGWLDPVDDSGSSRRHRVRRWRRVLLGE
jgi:hypothetical protein